MISLIAGDDAATRGSVQPAQSPFRQREPFDLPLSRIYNGLSGS
jgi:hypothetical protein